MKLLKDSWILGKQLVCFKGSREVYVLFAVAKLASFGIGVLVGYLLL
jgi:hypothetical protein